ncbi:MAG TPA: DUF423 domain-containing protein [Fimbriimonadaceae bacterium]|nr:DUF423 domain-containing protein [Fimbriimonadaceae bacterium]
MSRTLVVWGAILGFLGVALGAFGAHVLRERLSAESMEIFQTGVHYHMIHALALLGLGAIADRVRYSTIIGWLFIFGVAIFSGSLYLLAISQVQWWGAVTPIGGLCYLAGWALLAWGAAKGP